MPNDLATLLEAGDGALEAGDWQRAREAFEQSLDLEETPEALLGLGVSLSWLADMHGAIDRLERAYAAFRRRPDPAWAAAAALRLSLHYDQHLANSAAAAGWLARAARLVDDHGLDALRGELLLMRSCLASDLAAGEAFAREALELGRAGGDRDLELCGMSQLGLVLVEQGRVDEGVPLLDEAMAGCIGGEPESVETVAFSSCLTMRSCARCADFERAVQWVRATERFAQRYGTPFLQVECRVVHGAVLFATGAWAAADAELTTAIRLAAGGVPAFHAEAVAALADLRLAQGRIEEAERLLDGLDGYHATVGARARLHLARGEHTAAVATLERRLEAIGKGIQSAELRDLLGEALIGRDDLDAAAEHGRALTELGAALGCAVISARGQRLLGHALGAGDLDAARGHLDTACAEFVRLDMPYEAARTRFVLARALRSDDAESAAAEARSALAAFEQLGAGRDADAAAALLRQLGVKAARAGPKGLGTLTKREREVLALLGEGLSNPEIAARLFLSRKTVEHHVARTLSKLGLRNRAEAAALAARGVMESAAD